ncbi:hypothetical protein LIER_07905 [Lithospermum erythrorhizon]|uniref:Dgd1 suppressor 1 n=1 Tax=Lithospermum erythrorhizon TaxID=34254 RepID=A0AAV3PAP3_LITER
MSSEASPPSSAAASSSVNIKKSVSFYSSSVYNRLINMFPKSNSSDLVTTFSNIYHRSKKPLRRRRKTSLPLPLPSFSTSPDSNTVLTDASSQIFKVLEDIMEHAFLNLHHVQTNLKFWQSKAEGTNGQKAYFMICERGPSAFVFSTVNLVRSWAFDGSGMNHLYSSTAAYISERLTVLTSLRYFLSTFLAQVYMEIDRVGELLIKDPVKSLPSHLSAVNDLFLKLEASIGHFHATRQSGSSVDGSYSVPLMFDKLPDVNEEGSQWTDCEVKDALNLLNQNLQKLDSYISILVAKHRKPSNLTLHWMRYTCGVVGISVCSMWLLRHSSLMGSPDVENWIREAKESTVSFWNDHVEQPVLAIRDELFDTFKKRNKGAMEPEEVQLTADSLHRMLIAFSEQTSGKKFPEDASDQKMLELVMGRYEKEMMHPIQNLVGGELVRALLIQVQKLKLDIEEAMLELDQILRANEINFAILAALPAFFLSLLILMLLRAWFKQDARSEGRGRVARIQRRLLLVEIERSIMQFEDFKTRGQERDAECMFGLALYGLDSLYCAVENPARATGEWICIREDILDLGRPKLPTAQKLTILSRMERVYDCLLHSVKRQ